MDDRVDKYVPTVESVSHAPTIDSNSPDASSINVAKRRRKQHRLALMLFLLTCASTWATQGPDYAIAVMAILLAHEFGHFFQAMRYRVPASLPYFIPTPGFPFGTMGAVIAQQAGVADRRAMFDIAITGPLAGLFLALPITWWGLQSAQLVQMDPSKGSFIFADPLVLKWMIAQRFGHVPPGFEVELNPTLFAGWVGIFITALNLIPIGQLDGGHILYTLIGKKAHWVSIGMLVGAIGWMTYSQDLGYLVMVILLIVMGARHPPTANDTVPIGITRHFLGWLTLSFILIGFTAKPITINGPESPPETQEEVLAEQPQAMGNDRL